MIWLGSTWIRGLLSAVLGLSAGIVHAAPGDVDTSFGVGGIVSPPFFTPGTALPIDMVSDSSGRFYVLVAAQNNDLLSLLDPLDPVLVGLLPFLENFQAMEVLRFTSSGAVDVSFGDGGRRILATLPYAADFKGLEVDEAAQKLIVVGPYRASMSVARFGFDGVVDNSFGTEGYVNLARNSFNVIRTVKRLADGDILIAGTENSGGTIFVARLNQDGSFDTAFGDNGVATFTPGILGDKEPSVIALDSNGGLLLCGPVLPDAGASVPGVVVGRLTASGQPTAGFGVDGFRGVNFGYGVGCLAAKARAGGGFNIVGLSNSQLTIARVSAAGALDPGFDGDGLQQSPLSTTFAYPPQTALIQADGKLVLVGNSSSGANFGQIILTRIAGSPELAASPTTETPGEAPVEQESVGGGGAMSGHLLLLFAVCAGLRRYLQRSARRA